MKVSLKGVFMFKKILALGMVMTAVANAEQVEYNQWEGVNLVNRIILSQAMPDQDTIEQIKERLPHLQGGADRIYQRLLASWETGPEVYDYVPDHLIKLAGQIRVALLNDAVVPHDE